MDAQKLVETTNAALGDQEILGLIFNQAFQYDCLIKEEFKGDYNIQPGLIYPLHASPQSATALVKVNITRDGREKLYSFPS